MTHVDGYRTVLPPSKFFLDDGSQGSLTNPYRFNAEDGPLPARSNHDEHDPWNGYVWYSKPHEDGECEAYRPEQTDWVTYSYEDRHVGEDVLGRNSQ